MSFIIKVAIMFFYFFAYTLGFVLGYTTGKGKKDDE